MNEQHGLPGQPSSLPDGANLGRLIGRARPVGQTPAGGTAQPSGPDRFGGTTPASADAGDHEDLTPYAGTFYAEVGGSRTFQRLTELFYAGVANDPEFRAMYPDQDLQPATIRLQLFLEQYWGGPTTYSQHRGHPRLRMRHAPYVVNSANRDTWLRHMRNALDELALPPLQDATLWDYLERAAHSLQNAPDA